MRAAQAMHPTLLVSTAARATGCCASGPRKVSADRDRRESGLGGSASTAFEQAPELCRGGAAEASNDRAHGGAKTGGSTSQGGSSDGYLSTDRVQVKNTFIHVDEPESSLLEMLDGRHLQSAPAKVREFSTKYPSMDLAHIRGECKPCAYFLYKEDGCRQGANCQFCHLCSPGELKKRKREKNAARKLKADKPPADGLAAASGLVPFSFYSASEIRPASQPKKVTPSASAPPGRGAVPGVYNAFGSLVSEPSADKSAADALAAFSLTSSLEHDEEDADGTPRTVFGTRLLL